MVQHPIAPRENDQDRVLQGRSGFQQPDDLIPIQLGETQINKDEIGDSALQRVCSQRNASTPSGKLFTS